ncbi:GGDEF domain-containing protein [Parasalinivibrio latis]|uniref:GGDEF domain-containing protein n=1 Tax=Parasalinivibrio latis TaxID=2952610 RepID=UPI0030E0FF13
MKTRILSSTSGSILPMSILSISLIFLFFLYTVDVDRKTTLEDVRTEARHIAEITDLRLENELEGIHAILQDIETLMIASPTNLQHSVREYENRVKIISKVGVYFFDDGTQMYGDGRPNKQILEQPFFKLSEKSPFYWQPKIYDFDDPDMKGQYLVMSQLVEAWFKHVVVIYIDISALIERLRTDSADACSASVIFDLQGHEVFQLDSQGCGIRLGQDKALQSTVGQYWYSEVTDEVSNSENVVAMKENTDWAYGVLTVEDTSSAMGPWRERTEIRLLVCTLFLAVVIWLLRKIHLFQRELQNIAMHDALTGLGNRQYLERKIPKLLKQADKLGSAFSLILLDLDHFKKVNDRYGHDIGDEVLISCSEVLRKNVRDSDYIFRVGGEEFLILLPEADERIAKSVAERIREAMPVSHPKGTTASCGIATRKKGEDVGSLTKRADMALYYSKEMGRNLATTYSPSLSTWEI